MRFRVVPYKLGSKSAKLLAQELSHRVGYKVRRGAPRANRNNIPWGISHGVHSNKLATFAAFQEHGVSHPPFTNNRTTATEWLAHGGGVIARKLLNASGGRGAVYVEGNNPLPNAPLYVKYIPKKKEFRVHVWKQGTQYRVILVQEKRRRQGTQPDPKIRSHEQNWVFCFNNITEPSNLRSVALEACQAVRHGGAVDIVWNQYHNRCYALEVNTAPGLCPTSAQKYAEFITEELE